MAKSAKPPRVMVVEDDESVREIFEVMLRNEGWDVVTAMNGEVALEKIPNDKPDLILVDLMMPKLSGFEVIHKLQADGRGGIPIIVVTGYEDDANRRIMSGEPNVVDVVQKPVRDRKEFMALVRRHLESSSSAKTKSSRR